MNPLIYELFKQVQSEDERVSSNAITDLSFILEMHAWHLSKDEKLDRYRVCVSQAIVELEIDRRDEAEIVDFFCNEIANRNKFTASLLFSLGQATCNVAIRPLIDIIERHLDKFNENEVYQACVSLEKLLFFDESLSLEEEKKIIAETNLLSDLAKKILRLQPISNSELESCTLRLFARLILLLNDE